MDNKTRELMFSSQNPDFETPQKLFDELQAKYKITIDLCANENNKKCQNYISKEKNIFTTYWDENGFLNPPYNKPEKPCKKKCKNKKCQKREFHITEYVPGQIDFVKKVVEITKKNKKKTVCLLPARTDTILFHKYIWNNEIMKFRPGVTVNFLKGRIEFEGTNNSAPFPSMIVVFDGQSMI